MFRLVTKTACKDRWGGTMWQVMKRLRQWLFGEAGCGGVTVVEYAVVLGLIVLVCISTLKAIGYWKAPVFAQLMNGVSV